MAICTTDSKRVEDEIVDMIMCGNVVLSNMIGVYEYKPYDGDEE